MNSKFGGFSMPDTLAILGPTASGKSALSLAIAKLYECEIISLDSTLIYKGMDIGTAKPTKEELSICPHHLIDICNPDDTYSAADFRNDCIKKVEEIKARGRLPIICGGTMMYYKALVDGLSSVPQTDKKTREMVTAKGESLGWPKLHEELSTVDPVTAARLSPNDKQRISRALEVYYMTGKPLSSYSNSTQSQCPFSRLELVLLPEGNDRTKLREVIRERFMKMLDDGFIDEVKRVKESINFDPNLPSMRAVGYRQVLMYLNGEVSYDEMIELSVIATARLAKHQMTWLRGGLKRGAAASDGSIDVSSDDVNCLDKVQGLASDDESSGMEALSQRFYLQIEDPLKVQRALTLMPNEWQRYLKKA